MNDWGAPRKDRTLVSMVIPALNEADNAAGVLARAAALKDAHPEIDLELVIVDDGSTDSTGETFLKLGDGLVPLTVVELSRRFGSHEAISAGLRHASGDCAIVLGADAQEPTSLVEEFLSAWRAGAEIVWGIRRTRTGRSWRSELASRLFSWLFSRFARLEHYPPEGPSGMLIDRVVIDELDKLDERNRNVMALISWLGFRQERIEYDQIARRFGSSGWTPSRMIRLAVDSFLQFSTMPLRACTWAGLGVAALGIGYALVLVVRSLAGVDTPEGWPTLLVTVLLLSGLQLTVVGVIGEYLWRAIEEVRGRPLYVVRRVTRPSSPVKGRPS